MGKKHLGVLILMMGLSALPLAGCSKDKAKEPAPKPAAAAEKAAPQVLNIKVSEVQGKSVHRSVEAIGTLLPWDENIVNSEVPGIISKINYDLGDKVKSGTVLAVLDQKVPKLNLEDASAAHQTNVRALDKEEAKLNDAKTTLKRYEELFKQGMVSVSQFDSAKTQFDVANASVSEAEAKVVQSAAKLEVAKKRLADTMIKSPISGEVEKRYISVGQTVTESSKLFSVVSAGTLKFRGTVPEAAVPQIRTGQDVEVSVEAFRDKTFKGKLTRISPSVDTATRTLEIEATVPNPQGLLKPGFFAKGVILTKIEKNVSFVPEPALYSFVGITKVFVIADNVAHERQIKPGVRDGDMVEIIDKIKPGETIAVTNLSNLYDGAKVNIIK